MIHNILSVLPWYLRHRAGVLGPPLWAVRPGFTGVRAKAGILNPKTLRSVRNRPQNEGLWVTGHTEQKRVGEHRISAALTGQQTG